MNTYETIVKLSSGGLQKVTVQPDNWDQARRLLAIGTRLRVGVPD
jgi:hypothetical protein